MKEGNVSLAFLGIFGLFLIAVLGVLGKSVLGTDIYFVSIMYGGELLGSIAFAGDLEKNYTHILYEALKDLMGERQDPVKDILNYLESSIESKGLKTVYKWSVATAPALVDSILFDVKTLGSPNTFYIYLKEPAGKPIIIKLLENGLSFLLVPLMASIMAGSASSLGFKGFMCRREISSWCYVITILGSYFIISLLLFITLWLRFRLVPLEPVYASSLSLLLISMIAFALLLFFITDRFSEGPKKRLGLTTIILFLLLIFVIFIIAFRFINILFGFSFTISPGFLTIGVTLAYVVPLMVLSLSSIEAIRVVHWMAFFIGLSIPLIFLFIVLLVFEIIGLSILLLAAIFTSILILLISYVQGD